MPINEQVDVGTLNLDLSNYRTVKQQDEAHAIQAMISISPDRFWALLESILDDGYHPTENVIVQEDTGGDRLVKEGNRRIASLKISLGLVNGIDIPVYLADKICELNDEWKKVNTSVPCVIYSAADDESVDKVIALTHAKGEKAARDGWPSVARARYGRDKKGVSTPGLDLLESYLNNGRNLSPQQAERWAGDYQLSVLDEAIQKLSPAIGFASVRNLVSSYPKKNKKSMDEILLDIGTSQLGFKEIRDKKDFFGIKYGFNTPVMSTGSNTSTTSVLPSQITEQKDAALPNNPMQNQTSTNQQADTKNSKPLAVPSNDPKAVAKRIRSFKPRGNGREKVVTLQNEMKKLKISDHPHAFCFLLRSMFELSAKAYCADHDTLGGPSPLERNGKDKGLAKLLGDIVNHLTSNGTDMQQQKILHGASVEIAKPGGILSVTSMNQLVHNPSFSIQPSDICLLFGNVYPLLEAMNK